MTLADPARLEELPDARNSLDSNDSSRRALLITLSLQGLPKIDKFYIQMLNTK